MGRRPEKKQFLSRRENLRRIRYLADYQFGEGAGMVLFPDSVKFVISPKTGRVRQITDHGKRIATIKPSSGWLSLSIEGARRLHSFFPFPKLRVVVMNEVSEFIADGKNVFARHVVDVDRSVRAEDEVLVVDEKDALLATGKAVLAAIEMLDFERGVAVDVRAGINREINKEMNKNKRRDIKI
ncbi:MAG: pseudouridine synthase [Archaeoglobus sp.]|nr:pseudouridine synthase [Archaeoglobus sp.]